MARRQGQRAGNWAHAMVGALCIFSYAPCASADTPLLCLERLAWEFSPEERPALLPTWDEWLDRRAAQAPPSLGPLPARPKLRDWAGSRPKEALARLEAGVIAGRARRFWRAQGFGAPQGDVKLEELEDLAQELEGGGKLGSADGARLTIAIAELGGLLGDPGPIVAARLGSVVSEPELRKKILLLSLAWVPVGPDQANQRLRRLKEILALELTPVEHAYALLLLAETYSGLGEEEGARATYAEAVSLRDVEEPATSGELLWLRRRAWDAYLVSTAACIQRFECDTADPWRLMPNNFWVDFVLGAEAIRHPARDAVDLLIGLRLVDPSTTVEVTAAQHGDETSSGSRDALVLAELEDASFDASIQSAADTRIGPILRRFRDGRDAAGLSPDRPLWEAGIACLSAAVSDPVGVSNAVEAIHDLARPESEWMRRNKDNAEAWSALSLGIDLAASVAGPQP